MVVTQVLLWILALMAIVLLVFKAGPALDVITSRQAAAYELDRYLLLDWSIKMAVNIASYSAHANYDDPEDISQEIDEQAVIILGQVLRDQGFDVLNLNMLGLVHGTRERLRLVA